MENTHIAKRKSIVQKVPSQISEQKSESVSNIAVLYRMGINPLTSSEDHEDIKSAIMSRLPAEALQNQIPAAEQEADEIASAVKGARTPEDVKLQLGKQMGADFSSVRFHYDNESAAKADAIGARAYTTGRDIYFGKGEFSPEVAAHELVHTTQQGAVEASMQTTAAPAGGIQMMPKFLKTIGRGLWGAAKGIGSLVGGAISGATGLVGGALGGVAGLLAAPFTKGRSIIDWTKKGAKAGLAVGNGLQKAANYAIGGAATLGGMAGGAALGSLVGLIGAPFTKGRSLGLIKKGAAYGAGLGGLAGGAAGAFLGGTDGAVKGMRTGAMPGAYLMEKLGVRFMPGKEESEQRAEQGDMSAFATVSKDYAMRKTNERAEQINDFLQQNPDATSERIAQEYGGNATLALNPVNRKALSKIGNDANNANNAKVKDAMNMIDQKMWADTMLGPNQEDRDRIVNYYRNKEDLKQTAKEYSHAPLGKRVFDEESTCPSSEELEGERTNDEAQALANSVVERDQAASDTMLRMALMAQLGKFQKKEGDQVGDWDQTIAHAFSHGGRTGFLFGANEKDNDGNAVRNGTSNDVMRALFNSQEDQALGQNAGLFARASGTHHLITPGVGEDVGKFHEKHGVKAAISSSMDSKYHHMGMNLAVGGAGKQGGAGENRRPQLILPNGSSGHGYFGIKDSTDTHHGGLLFGLESDSPYHENQTGHMHNAAADSEEASSTGGLKTDMAGDKYNGRSVDLSGIGNGQLTEVLTSFSQHLAQARQNPENHRALINQIIGNRMSNEQMTTMLSQFMPRNQNETDEDYNRRIAGIVNRARKIQN